MSIITLEGIRTKKYTENRKIQKKKSTTHTASVQTSRISFGKRHKIHRIGYRKHNFNIIRI